MQVWFARFSIGVASVVILIGLMLVVLAFLSAQDFQNLTTMTVQSTPPIPARTVVPEQIVPTLTPRPPTPSPCVDPIATITPVLYMPTPTASHTLAPFIASPVIGLLVPMGDYALPGSELWRLGVSLPFEATSMQLAALRVGWVMNWHADIPPARPEGVSYARMVRFMGGVLKPRASQITSLASANPGALWLISNEADVRWQDNVDAETYARLYHEAYVAIKSGDPHAVVAVGGIAQPTPLRLRYLDAVLSSYEAQFGETMPMQAWHIHNYMLREERNSWGVDIPPGMFEDTGALFEIEDSGNLDLFRYQIYAFRAWMSRGGYRNLPLIVSEFGIPMPADYGFESERVQTFLRETIHYFINATDANLGQPDDGGRLVQQWCWFSVHMDVYPTGNLLDAPAGEWTHLGLNWLAMVGSRVN